jgi:putative flavoprotein involved in K+ transport
VERWEAIVAGAGPAELAAAAVLKRRGFDVLVIERGPAVGMRWRERYEGLRLNTMRVFSTLPGYRFERRYGRYPRREDLVEYLERYAAHHGLAIRFETELRRVEAADDGGWRLATRAHRRSGQHRDRHRRAPAGCRCARHLAMSRPR